MERRFMFFLITSFTAIGKPSGFTFELKSIIFESICNPLEKIPPCGTGI